MPHPDKPSAAPGVPVPKPYPYASEPAFPPKIGAQPTGMPQHACMGLNSCAGSDRYGAKGPPGGQPNACAGQGYCSTAVDHTCHVQNSCRNQGGCGLYGTGEEMDNPGANDCASLGSCATPINAERFSTNGPNRGKSVWVRARAVFEEKVWPACARTCWKSRPPAGSRPTSRCRKRSAIRRPPSPRPGRPICGSATTTSRAAT